MAPTQQLDPEFSAVRLTRYTTRITDRLDVLMYLVEGQERAVLIDTGFGVGDLPGFVKGLSDKPLTVLLTHGHLDHAFGAAGFDDVRMSPLDAPVLRAHQALSAEVLDAARQEGRLTAAVPDPQAFEVLSDGQVFDLGGVHVRSLAVPGHTPGSTVFLVAEDRLLITGDAANQRTFLFHEEASSVRAYQESLARLRRDTAGLYDRVHVSHGSGDTSVDLLADLDALCTRIRRGTDDAVPFEFMGVSGVLARRVGGTTTSAGVDDNANIVYDPTRIERTRDA
ncbi:MBL fold metallo-hydrolase [Kineococcus sp. GCM10028916]|uniref:MBL fold metallo-hydrolase n=1 Tax=Kineococcus sp. GCM10028916 TaxID=3273394 RepID=UPI00362AE4A6